MRVNIVLRVWREMQGMDDKNVCAIADGVVESVNAHGKSYGKHVCIKHADGMVSLYAHLSSVAVKVGQSIKIGQKVGVMGATGNASGAHLHLELHQGRYRYPAKGSSPLTEKDLVDAWAWIEDHIGTDENKPSDWAKADWDWCKANRYLDGTRPKDGVTREELAAVIRRIAGK